ncbi:MAG: dihydropteroate synthase [Phycisphaerae bacterium]|nr:dihydropteroate synthase [Phycisphaerae bacterium]
MQPPLANIVEWPTGRLDFSAGPLLMGVLNITPDSFSDGGRFLDANKAIEHGLQMAANGAAIIDIGAESTRPGAEPVPTHDQINHAVPVIKALREKSNVPISIDTKDVEVAAAALDAGASIINDITALSDEQMAELAGERGVPVILMHMQGTPATMQAEPTYQDVVAQVLEYLINRARQAEKFLIAKERIFIDPGIGFGKTLEHNLLLLRNIDKFVASGYRVLVGTSRKSFIGKLTGKKDPAQRIFGTAATVALCAAAGVSILRVHDVPQMVDVVKVAKVIANTTMTLRARGESTSQAEVSHINNHGLWLCVNDLEYFLPYDEYPWFRDAKVKEILNVKLLHGHHLNWPDLDVDLEIDALENPQNYPLKYE